MHARLAILSIKQHNSLGEVERVGGKDSAVGDEDVRVDESLVGGELADRGGGAVATDGIGGVGHECKCIDLLLPDGLDGVVACCDGYGVERVVAPRRGDYHVGFLEYYGRMSVEERTVEGGAAPGASEDEDAVGRTDGAVMSVDVPRALGGAHDTTGEIDAVATCAVQVDLDSILALQHGGGDTRGFAIDGEGAGAAEREVATHLDRTIEVIYGVLGEDDVAIVFALALEDGAVLATQREAFEVESVGGTAADGEAAVGGAEGVGAGGIAINEVGNVLRIALDDDMIAADGAGHIACCRTPDTGFG